MTKQIIYMIGLPGTGKSTYIQNNLLANAVVISNDLILEDFCKEKGLTYTEAYGKLPYPIIQEQCFDQFYKAIKKVFQISLLIIPISLLAHERNIVQLVMIYLVLSLISKTKMNIKDV